jgi:small subunit ribosomal protein S16
MVKLKLHRMGKKKQPSYRLVVTESTSACKGKYLVNLGYYNPLTNPATIVFKEEQILEWMKKGAQPTESVKKLLTRCGIWEKFEKDKKSPKIKKSTKIEKSTKAEKDEKEEV